MKKEDTMIRHLFRNRPVFLAALALLMILPMVGRAQDSFAAVEIHNNTSDLTVYYSVRWGIDAKWTEVALKPGIVWSHWFPDDRPVPTLEIIFNSGIGTKRSQTTYV